MNIQVKEFCQAFREEVQVLSQGCDLISLHFSNYTTLHCNAMLYHLYTEFGLLYSIAMNCSVIFKLTDISLQGIAMNRSMISTVHAMNFTELHFNEMLYHHNTETNFTVLHRNALFFHL